MRLHTQLTITVYVLLIFHTCLKITKLTITKLIISAHHNDTDTIIYSHNIIHSEASMTVLIGTKCSILNLYNNKNELHYTMVLYTHNSTAKLVQSVQSVRLLLCT